LIDNKSNVKVSVIMYSNFSEIVIENEIPRIELLDRITFKGGSTSFEEPLMHGYEIAKRHFETDKKTVMLFMSDGVAEFPT